MVATSGDLDNFSLTRNTLDEGGARLSPMAELTVLITSESKYVPGLKEQHCNQHPNLRLTVTGTDGLPARISETC